MAMQATKWPVDVNAGNAPRQQNGHDCGVFAIMCANYAAADRRFDYGQRDVHAFFRPMCTLECSVLRLRPLED